MTTTHDWFAKTSTNCYGHRTKMATTPIYGKNSSISSSLEQKANGLGTWYVALGMWALPWFAQMINLG